MKFSLLFSAFLSVFSQYVEAKSVFAHFMVSNTAQFQAADWQTNFNLAKESKIDAFAMNIGRNDPNTERLLTDAFNAAIATNFKLFLNFDYVSGGVWTVDEVVALIRKYSDYSSYFKYSNKAFVSTFEGAGAHNDWKSIKAQIQAGIFFVPSWASYSPWESLGKGVADGLASWDAWPVGINDMFTNGDEAFKLALNGKPYMMPVSPWFFSNMPGYDKKWVWRGDSLWYDRWNQVFKQSPEFIQIISWNDFGESHYIGPLDTRQYAAFDGNHGKAPYNYAHDVPHNGWRKFLPFVIDMYKSGTSRITTESVVTWYRKSSAVNPACSNGGATGNTAAKLQDTYGPSQLLSDRVYYSALLGSPADVTVSIGGVSITAGWEFENTPIGGVGIYHGSVSFTGQKGDVWVTIKRGSSIIIQMKGHAIADTCPNGIQNYNPYVGSKDSTATISAVPLAITHCNAGTGPGRYVGLCTFTCRYGYCPEVCTCNLMGPKPSEPAVSNTSPACPAPGFDKSFSGLCNYHCQRGPCSPSACRRIASGVACNPPEAVAPTANVCKAGTALAVRSYFAPLCDFTCRYGKCPPEICVCTAAGQPPTNTPPALTGATGWSSGFYGADFGLCEWACARGTCPANICVSSIPATSTTSQTASSTPVVTQIKRSVHGHGHAAHAAFHAGLHGK